MTKQFALLLAPVLFAITFSVEAKAQWLDGKVAVRTNGNNFQSGDQLLDRNNGVSSTLSRVTIASGK
jgi:hypothetical protein